MAKRFLNESVNDLLYLDDDELDTVKAFLAYTLMKNTPLDKEDIYTYVFGEGRKILWN